MGQILAIAIAGWVIGALVNYLSDFLPVDRRFVWPHCLNCNSRQPLFCYLIWPRRCSVCSKTRGIRPWIVEFLFVLAAVWFWRMPPPGMNFLAGMLVLAYFCLVMVIDIEHRLILHPVSLFGAVIGLVLGIYLHGLVRTLIGGLVGFLIMLLLYLGGTFFIRFLSRWRNYSEIEEALGFGDVILGGVLGLMLGWSGIVLGLFLAILIAGVVSLFVLVKMLILRRYQANMTVAYGPFLVLSAFILLFLRGVIFTNPFGW
jgi:leader peptidase (prepilin peptidase) / N-methyltransferase